MKLTRPLCVLDTETTGVDPVQDRVIELGITILHPNGTRTKWGQRLNPGMSVPSGATAVHGITDEMLAGCPAFAEMAPKIHRGLQGKDIAGFNLRGLDLPILDEEFRRCGLKLDLSDAHIIDAFGIFSNKEPRNLTAAVQKYCGRSHEDAHGASADAEATLDVLLGQLAVYEDLAAMELADLAKFSRRGDKDPADLAGKLYRDESGDLRYNFGKCRGVKVKEDPGFGYWMLRQVSPPFPGHTLELLRAELETA